MLPFHTQFYSIHTTTGQAIPGNSQIEHSWVIFEVFNTTTLKRCFLFIFFALGMVIPSLAQQAKKYAFMHFGHTAGLASNEVTSSIQDEQGYMWIGTNNGLQRYDGVRFKTFRHSKNNPQTISSNFIQQLLMDKQHNLWILLGHNKAGVFNTKTFIFREVPIKPQNIASHRAERKLIIDGEGRLMIVVGNMELLTYSSESDEFSPAHNFIKFPVEWAVTDVIHQPGTKRYWIGTQKGNALFDAATGELSYYGHNLAKSPFLEQYGTLAGCANFFYDMQGRLWFDRWEGSPRIYCYDIGKSQVFLHQYSLMPHIRKYHEVRTVMQQRNGSIWIRGNGVFGKFNEKDKEFELVFNGYENEQSIAFTKIDCLFEDREENIWVSTANNGLYHFNPSAQFFNNVRIYNRDNGMLGEGSFMSFAVARGGSLLAGAWGDGLFRFDSEFNQIPLHIKGLSEKITPSMWSMMVSKDSNTIWVGAQPGIHRINQANRTIESFNPRLFYNQTVRQVIEDPLGNIWIGTQNRGLFKWNAVAVNKKLEEGIHHFASIPREAIFKMMVDSKGFLWVCTGGSGVYKIDPATNQILIHLATTEQVERRLNWDAVVGVTEYDDSTMIIASNVLTVFNTKTQRISRTIGSPEHITGNIAAIEKDEFGYVWVSATSGIYRVNPRNLIFIHFNRVDGIGNDYFITAASLRLPDGRLIFGADNQLVYFDPKAVQINNQSPVVAINEFRIGNRSLRIDSLEQLSQITLGPDDNELEIDFSGLSFGGAFIIKYRLEGLEKDWKMADKNYQAIYSYLAPGTYTLQLRSEDAEGRPNNKITQLIIKIRPPFWKTWWFLGLVMFATITIMYLLDRLRMQRLRDSEGIRTRIATSLTEDMSNSLSSINISSELAKTKMDSDKQRTKEYIGQISETSNRMVQAMYDMVWSIDPKNDTMTDTLERMKIFASETEHLYPVIIDFDVDKQVSKLTLNMEQRYELLSIYKEAMTNAARHADGRYIKVSIRYNRTKLMMMIIDDGKGFSLDDAAMLGRGMSDMRRRAAIVSAVLYVESEINTGTVIKVEMPVIK